MENRENKECRQLILFYFAVFIFFGIMLTIGTFYDETIEVAVYSPDNILAKIVTSTGAYPFFAFSVLFIGALCETIIRSKWKKPVKVILCIPFYLIATFVGFIGAGALVDRWHLPCTESKHSCDGWDQSDKHSFTACPWTSVGRKDNRPFAGETYCLSAHHIGIIICGHAAVQGHISETKVSSGSPGI